MTYKWEAMVEDLTVERDRLRKALEDIFGLIDSGWFVRNVSEDGKAGWAFAQIAPLKKLADARAALNLEKEQS